MVLNKGGNKTKRKGRKNFRVKTFSLDDLKPSLSDNQAYGFINEKYGDGRFKVICYDKVERLGIIRGAIKQKSRVNKGHLVLLSLRPYEDSKCDILYHYTEDDIHKLTKANLIEKSFVRTGKLSTQDEEEVDMGNNDTDNHYFQNSDDSSLDESVEAWASDDSQNTKKSKDENNKTDKKYPPNIINDIRCSLNIEDNTELNIDDI